MAVRRPFSRPAGYLDSPHREVREYTHGDYLFLKLTDYRTGETKQLRRINSSKGWRCFKPWELTVTDRMVLGKKLHLEGLWAPETAADFLLLNLDNLNTTLGIA